MNDNETKVIEESIAAYKRMIEYFRAQIRALEAKKIEPCCFEDKIKYRLKIKGKVCRRNKKIR